MEDVSYTAQWTAAARSLESDRTDDALFHDPHAEHLAAPRGFELLEKYRGGGVTEFIAVRTRYMDDSIQRILAAGEISQVVLVANGMDTRTYRLSWPAQTIVYEVDHGSLQQEKKRRMQQLSATRTVKTTEVGADLAEDWLPLLESAGFDAAAPTLWVAEGLLFFLTADQVGNLLDTLAGAAAPGSRLAVDMTSAATLKHPMTQSFLKALRADGTPWRFGTDTPAALLAEHGWTVTDLKQPGEPGAGAGRWPYEVVPAADRRPVPRNWLVNAAIDTAGGRAA